MKSKPIFFIVLFIIFSTAVRANNSPIPITANESITVTLFFPTEIQKVIQPATNYKFEFEQNSTMATLLAKRGADSNLTVITKCGSIFSFSLKYNTEVSNFTYVISEEQAIGKMKDSGAVAVSKAVIQEKEMTKSITPKDKVVVEPKITSVNSEKTANKRSSTGFTELTDISSTSAGGSNSLYETNKTDYYQVFCENNYSQKPQLKNPIFDGAFVTLQLNTIAADKNELYFILEINNTLGTEFNTSGVNFYVRTRQIDKPLVMTPLYVFNSPNGWIAPGEKTNMVYVFKNFKLGSNQKVFIVMDEAGGKKKKVMLKVDSETINTVGR